MAQAVKQASSALRTAQQHCSAPVQPTRTHRRGYPAQAAPRALSPQLHEDAPSQQGSSAQGMSREVRKALCKTVKAQRKALERQLKCGAVVAPAAYEVTASPGAEVVVNSLVQQLRELELQRQRTQQALTATQAAQGPIFGAADAALTQAGPAPPPPQPARIQVCVGKPCAARGGQQLLQAVATLADGNTAVEVTPCKCLVSVCYTQFCALKYSTHELTAPVMDMTLPYQTQLAQAVPMGCTQYACACMTGESYAWRAV